MLHGAEALEPPVDPVIAQVQDALNGAGHESSSLAVGNTIEPLIAQLRSVTPDLVFNLTESFNDKSALDSNLAALLNLLELRYTGSSPSGLVLAGDKSLTKKLLSFHQIRTPEFATLYRGAADHVGDLRFPLIVKPPQEDASIGISEKSVVRDVGELLSRIDELQAAYQSPVLVEEFVPGREFYVGVLGNQNARALPVIELEFRDRTRNPLGIASFDVKWSDERDHETASIFPEDLPEELSTRMQSIAVEAFHALRLRDYARIDLRVNEAGEVFVIEVTPTATSSGKVNSRAPPTGPASPTTSSFLRSRNWPRRATRGETSGSGGAGKKLSIAENAEIRRTQRTTISSRTTRDLMSLQDIFLFQQQKHHASQKRVGGTTQKMDVGPCELPDRAPARRSPDLRVPCD